MTFRFGTCFSTSKIKKEGNGMHHSWDKKRASESEKRTTTGRPSSYLTNTSGAKSARIFLAPLDTRTMQSGEIEFGSNTERRAWLGRYNTMNALARSGPSANSRARLACRRRFLRLGEFVKRALRLLYLPFPPLPQLLLPPCLQTAFAR